MVGKRVAYLTTSTKRKKDQDQRMEWVMGSWKGEMGDEVGREVDRCSLEKSGRWTNCSTCQLSLALAPRAHWSELGLPSRTLCGSLSGKRPRGPSDLCGWPGTTLHGPFHASLSSLLPFYCSLVCQMLYTMYDSNVGPTLFQQSPCQLVCCLFPQRSTVHSPISPLRSSSFPVSESVSRSKL
jgi:hypothetical protein